MVIDKKFAGAAAATLISSSMTPTVPGTGQTFTVADATGYPATGAFVVVLDRGESNEEKVLVSSRSGITFTVGSRGYDGTTAATHTADQSTCEHPLDAVTVQLLVDHVDGVEVNPHDGVLLDIADHDIEARHQFGSGLAFGVPVTPTALTPDNGGSTGSGNNPAREDHTHDVPTAAPSDIGTANDEGAAASFARSDHVHNDPYCRAYEVDNAAAAVTLTTTYQNVCDASLSLPAGIYVFVGQAKGAASVSTPVTHTYRIRNTTDAVDIGDEVSAGIDDRTADNEHSSAIVATATLAATKTIQLQGKTDTLNGTQFSDDSRLVAIRVAALT